MEFLSQLVNKIGGEQAIGLINDQVTPLLLQHLKPSVSNYVQSHVERTREELFLQLPSGVHEVLDNLVPNNVQSNRGIGSDGTLTRGFMDDIESKIREKIGEILEKIKQKVQELVREVTSSTTGRVTDSVIDIAKAKFRLGAKREVEINQNNGSIGQRGLSSNENWRSGNGDFLDTFIDGSLREIQPLVQKELKSIYLTILEVVPTDARKILCAIVPGLNDEQSSNQGQNYNQQNNNQYQNYNQGSNQYQNYNQQDNNQYQNYNQQNNNQYQNYNDSNQFNQPNYVQNSSRGLEDEPRSRGLFSDIKNMANQIKNDFKQGNFNSVLNTASQSRSSQQLLEEFQQKARSKVDVITTQIMNALESRIMETVSSELRTMAREKLSALKF